MSLFGNLVRGGADIMTFGTNELAGNPAGKMADQIVNPSDPNAANNALNAQSLGMTQQNNLAQQQLAQQNIQMQEDFAQNGISWRISDAAKNGISPLAALGASEPGYSPVTEVMNTPNFIPNQYQPSAVQSLVTAGAGELGQGLARSLFSAQSAESKANAALDLAFKSKQNDLLDLQIANSRLKLAQLGNPSMPLAWSTIMNRDGTTSVVPSPEVANQIHAKFGGSTLWSLDNGLIPEIQNAKPILDWVQPSNQGSRWRDAGPDSGLTN